MHRLLFVIPESITSRRLRLRPYRPGDGAMYYAVGRRNRDHLSRYEADNPIRTLATVEEAEILVREYAAEWAARRSFFMGAFLRTTEEFVAQVTLIPIDWDLPQFSVGYWADVDRQGQGFVTEAVRAAARFAFVHLQAHRLAIECDGTNERSLRVAERAGFTREGHLRQNKRHPDGTISGTLLYGLLADEFGDGRPPSSAGR
jgi:RimJ/RimL family protein N-acetyltransferase